MSSYLRAAFCASLREIRRKPIEKRGEHAPPGVEVVNFYHYIKDSDLPQSAYSNTLRTLIHEGTLILCGRATRYYGDDRRGRVFCSKFTAYDIPDWFLFNTNQFYMTPEGRPFAIESIPRARDTMYQLEERRHSFIHVGRLRLYLEQDGLPRKVTDCITRRRHPLRNHERETLKRASTWEPLAL